jgi:hypothetical protein
MLGRKLFEEGYFKYAIEHSMDISIIYDDVATMYKNKTEVADKPSTV